MIPKKVNICGVPFDVSLVKNNFDFESHWGQIDYDKGQIIINCDLPESLQKQVLCHEIVHGILTMNHYDEESHNEQFVQALALAINQAFSVIGIED